MLERTQDGLRGINIVSKYGGRQYKINIIQYESADPLAEIKSVHAFGVYGHMGSSMAEWPGIMDQAMRIQRELAARSECDGLTNWETANMALEIKHDGANYADRRRWFEAMTELNNTVTSRHMRNFAEIHGYLRDKAPTFLELVDWVDIARWFEEERKEWHRDRLARDE